MLRLVMSTCTFILIAGINLAAHAEVAVQTTGTLVIVPAEGSVKTANDEAQLTLMIEESDKDKATAASRVNLKMKQGMEIVKREDPHAILSTRGYYTYPVYPEDQSRPNLKARQPASWRVGQYLEVRTTNLDHLPKTVASVQKVLALNGLQFGLTEPTRKLLDQKQIESAYKNLNDRIAFIAKAMGRSLSDAVLDTVDFEGSGAYAPQEASMAKAMRAGVMESAQVEEPSFEPGETTLNMRIVGKVKFK